MWLGLVVCVVVVEVAGLLLVAGVVASTVASAVGRGALLAIVFAVAWFLGGGLLLRRISAHRKDVATLTRSTWLATMMLATALFAWTSLRTTTVNEVVAHGRPASDLSASTGQSATTPAAGSPAAASGVDIQLAAGRFHNLDESASGTAAVVQLASGGRVLTLTDFASSNGPDVRVYLVAGRVTGAADVHDKVDLGGLKGNRGDQQYSIADTVDIGRYSTVVIFCRSFSIAFGAAELSRS